MPAADVDIGTGATLTFAGFTYNIESIDWGSVSRESIDTSHLSTPKPAAGEFGSRTFIPGDLSDPGEVSVEFQLNPDHVPPIDGPVQSIELDFDISGGGLAGAKFAGNGYCQDFDFTIPLEDKMMGSATFKLSGPVTVTAET